MNEGEHRVDKVYEFIKNVISSFATQTLPKQLVGKHSPNEKQGAHTATSPVSRKGWNVVTSHMENHIR